MRPGLLLCLRAAAELDNAPPVAPGINAGINGRCGESAAQLRLRLCVILAHRICTRFPVQ